LAGFRAIIPENVWVEEVLPSKGYFWWRVRRAQHLLQHFSKAFKLRGLASKEFRRILAIEWFLHVVNPFLLLVFISLLIGSVLIARSPLALGILALGIALLGVKQFKTWIVQQFYLITAALRNLRGKEIVWCKQSK